VKAGREVAPSDTGRLFVKSLTGIERALERAAGVEATRLPTTCRFSPRLRLPRRSSAFWHRLGIMNAFA